MPTTSQNLESTPLETVPPTLLPTDPHLLSKYLRTCQLSSLRSLYEYKTDQVAKDVAAQYDATRGRGGRMRRRRGSSPLVEERDRDKEDMQDLIEVRKKIKWDPALVASASQREGDESREETIKGTAETLASTSTDRPHEHPSSSRSTTKRKHYDSGSIDPIHTYDLVYDVSPDWSADSYYHGPHPPPPSRVIRSVLNATRQPPFYDPSDLSIEQLEKVTKGMWEMEGKAVSVNFGETNSASRGGGVNGLTREEQRIQKEMNYDEMVEWEERVVAGFSATCHERIGRGLAVRPPGNNVVASSGVEVVGKLQEPIQPHVNDLQRYNPSSQGIPPVQSSLPPPSHPSQHQHHHHHHHVPPSQQQQQQPPQRHHQHSQPMGSTTPMNPSTSQSKPQPSNAIPSSTSFLPSSQHQHSSSTYNSHQSNPSSSSSSSIANNQQYGSASGGGGGQQNHWR